jgi:hydroxyquinol 1,2-dioxygenase
LYFKRNIGFKAMPLIRIRSVKAQSVEGMDFANESSITEIAVARWRDAAHDPRLGELMAALVRHLHDYARETQLTEQEWFEATEFLTRVGTISNDKRKEFILLSDTLGLSMLVELMNNRRPEGTTQPTLLGPFYISGSPVIAYGGRLPAIADQEGTPLFLTGHIFDEDGAPIDNATLDIWQTDDSGIYEAQLIGDEIRHRGITHSRADGSYLVRTVVPTGYPVPTDGPVGQLLAQTDISDFRPSHVHFKIMAEGHEALTTHLFDRASHYLDSDVVFGTRDNLLVDLVPRPAGRHPTVTP